MMPLEADPDFFWEQLFERIGEERVVPVIGQDLLRVPSEGGEVPLYSLLAGKLAARLGVPATELPVQGALHEVACRYMAKGGRIADVYGILKKVMPEDLPIPEPLRQLAAVRPLKLFVTTTFDPLLRHALDEARHGGRPETQVVNYYPNARDAGEIDPGRDTVIHLFGALSSFPEYAVTEEDMLEFMHSLLAVAPRPAFVRELARMQLLVLGCGFPDWLVRFFLRAGLEDRFSKPHGKTDILADPCIQADTRLLSFLERFSPETMIFRGGGALELVGELHRRWTAENPEKGTGGATTDTGAIALPSGVKPGAVFLSYAHEDAAAAAALRDALQAAGMSVWFDKQSLKAGDDFERNIRRAIGSCSLFVAVLSRTSLTQEARFFRLEWRQAIDHAKKLAANRTFLVPVRIDDVDPASEALPEELGALHCVTLPGGQGEPDFVNQLREKYRRYQAEQRPVR
jgi:hypothetical protein